MSKDKRRRRPTKPARKTAKNAPVAPADLKVLQQARALWQQDKLIESAQLFQQAATEHPNNVVAISDASRALGALYQFDKAESMLARILPKLATNATAWLLVGQSYRLLRRSAQAIECFEKALQHDANCVDAMLELALLYERSNQLQQANESINARLAKLPREAESLVLKGRLYRRQGEFDRAIETLDRVTRNKEAFWQTRSRAASELAQTHDALGAYDAAWEAAVLGKQLATPHAASARQHRDLQMETCGRLADQFTKDHLQDWRSSAGEPNGPQVVLLTGLPRSGTTLIEQLLSQHSQIVTADELDAFPRLLIPLMLAGKTLGELQLAHLSTIPQDRLQSLRETYLQWMHASLAEPPRGVLVDKNPSLLPTLPLFLRLHPSAKVIVARRDPRDVFVSYMMTHSPPNDFSVDFIEPEAGAERVLHDLRLWEKLRDHLPESFVEVNYEDVVADSAGSMRTLTDTVGLLWEPTVASNSEGGSGRIVNSPTYAEVAEPIYDRARERWRNYERHLPKALLSDAK